MCLIYFHYCIHCGRMDPIYLRRSKDIPFYAGFINWFGFRSKKLEEKRPFGLEEVLCENRLCKFAKYYLNPTRRSMRKLEKFVSYMAFQAEATCSACINTESCHLDAVSRICEHCTCKIEPGRHVSWEYLEGI